MKKTKLLLALCLAGSIAHAQIIYTAAGTGTSGNTGDGGFAVSAKLHEPFGVITDASGNLYIADVINNTIRKVSSIGIITKFAGTGTAGYSGDGGQATAAKLNQPSAVAIDGSGNLYIGDGNNYVIRKINTSGVISTFAGTGTQGYTGDGGAASSAEIMGADQITFDGSGNLYFTDGYGVRKINTSGIISTVAGNGTLGYTGDGGQATSAELHGTEGIAIDASGNIFIADDFNNVIRKVNTSGIISTYAGTGTASYTGDGGAASLATLNTPRGICIDASGNLYIGDSGNSAVRKINSSGNISTIIGNGTIGNSGDGGSPSSAKMGLPWGVYANSSGNIYITDAFYSVVREVSAVCPAIAGPNKIVINPGACCAGIPVVIGSPAVPNMTYSWSPSTLLTPNTSTAQPTSSWSNTSTCQIYTVTVSYSLCTTATSTVQVCAQAHSGAGCCKIAAGIATENQSDVAFNVFPNPANGQVTIALYDKATYIHVVDMQGRVVFEAKDVNAGNFKLDISKYNKGVYFLSAKMGDTIEKQKLIVE